MRGNTNLDNYAYDDFLSRTKKKKELRERTIARRDANKGGKGWHFGCSDKPFYTKDVNEFRQELKKRGLVIRDEITKSLR